MIKNNVKFRFFLQEQLGDFPLILQREIRKAVVGAPVNYSCMLLKIRYPLVHRKTFNQMILHLVIPDICHYRNRCMYDAVLKQIGVDQSCDFYREQISLKGSSHPPACDIVLNFQGNTWACKKEMGLVSRVQLKVLQTRALGWRPSTGSVVAPKLLACPFAPFSSPPTRTFQGAYEGG